MNPDYIPAVFVALILTPNQFDLFDEVEAEAFDVLDGKPTSRSTFRLPNAKGVFLERERARLALSWSTLPASDVLSLAIGPKKRTASAGEGALACEDAHASANQLREMVQRCEALFDVSRSVWQITYLPLDEDTVQNHANRLSATLSSAYQQDTPFIALRPDEEPNPQKRRYGPSHTGLLARIRASFKAANEDPSWAMQASALALSSTFVLVTPPVGIAMFTYAALRQSTDMDLLPGTLNLAHWASGETRSRVNKRGLRVSVVPD